jgi:ATP-dependent DNA helicase DinG
MAATNINEETAHESEIIYELPDGVSAKDLAEGEFVFAAYGCALVERQTPSGMYVYPAVNFSTHKSEILSRRKRKLDKSGFGDMAEKISASAVRGEWRFAADKKPGESLKIGAAVEIATRIFKEILPRHGYAVREKQLELTEHILGVIKRRGVTLAESEVGTGKTHAYIVAAALAKRGRLNDFWLRGSYPKQGWAESAHMPIVISTSSVALQKAIVTDYIPELSRILLRHGIIRTPLTAVVRKGKEHFICEKRLRAFCTSSDRRTNGLLEPFIGATAPFDLTVVDSLSPYMKRHICVSGKCREDCKSREDCRYQRYLKNANNNEVDFQITNHNFFLADTLHRVGGIRPLLPAYQMVIIDEAHKFLQAARQMYGVGLTDAELPELAQEIHTFAPDKGLNGVNVHKLAKKLDEQSKRLFRRLNENIPESDNEDDAERFPAVIDEDCARHLRSISGIADELGKVCADCRVPAIYKERRGKAVWRLKTLGDRVSALRKQDKQIYWFEKRVEGEAETDALCAIPKDLDKKLFDDLWGKGIPIVLTSGTLSASGDFTRVKETLGLNRLPPRLLFDTSMPSPFDHKRNALLYISENVPFPDNKDKNILLRSPTKLSGLSLSPTATPPCCSLLTTLWARFTPF